MILSGLFNAIEISIISLRSTQIKDLIEHKKVKERTANLILDSNRFVTLVQSAITLNSLMSSAFGGITLSRYLEPLIANALFFAPSKALAQLLSTIIITLLMTLFILLFGELIPKQIAINKNKQIAYNCISLITVLSYLLSPISGILYKIASMFIRMFYPDTKYDNQHISLKELKLILLNNNPLNTNEKLLIQYIFNARNKRLQDIMVPRVSIEMLQDNLTIYEAIEIIKDKPYSRYPIIDKTSDNITGFIHIRDLFYHLHSKNNHSTASNIRIKDIARNVLFLPNSLHILSVLINMKKHNNTQMVVVSDDYGGTDGIVTMEDILEEIVGDIYDEYDIQENAEIKFISPNIKEIDGFIKIDHFCKKVDINIEDGPFETLAGFLLYKLQHIPKVGEYLDYQKYRFTIIKVDEHRIQKVRLSIKSD